MFENGLERHIGLSSPQLKKTCIWELLAGIDIRWHLKRGVNATVIVDSSVIDNLMSHVLNIDNLRPVAHEVSNSLTERNADVSARIVAVQGRLDEVQRAINKLVDAVEKAGFSTNLQARLQEEREIIAELAVPFQNHSDTEIG